MTHRHFGIPFPIIRPSPRAPIDPPVKISISRDGGRTWTTAHHLTPGQVRSGARHHAPPEAGRNLSSLAADPPFPRSPFTQALIDVTAVFFAFLFVSVTALAIVGALFIAFFVSV